MAGQQHHEWARWASDREDPQPAGAGQGPPRASAASRGGAAGGREAAHSSASVRECHVTAEGVTRGGREWRPVPDCAADVAVTVPIGYAAFGGQGHSSRVRSTLGRFATNGSRSRVTMQTTLVSAVLSAPMNPDDHPELRRRHKLQSRQRARVRGRAGPVDELPTAIMERPQGPRHASRHRSAASYPPSRRRHTRWRCARTATPRLDRWCR